MTDTLLALRPVSRQAQEAVNRDEIRIDRLPFRIGRESRVGIIHGKFQDLDRRRSDLPPSNDLYLLEDGRVLYVSREHFQIERKPNGRFELVDRGSACGTLVDDDIVGGNDRGGRHLLSNGSMITVGGTGSPFVFEFICPSRD